MSDSQPYPFTFQSWADVHRILRAKAEASRGTVTITADGEPTTAFPHTTSQDAFEIAMVFDTAIEDHASGAIVQRWITEADLLAGEDDSPTPYVGNRSFWDTLAAAVIELDRVHAPLPALSRIDDAMRELDAARPTAQQPRNATSTMFVTVLSEPSWKAMALRQLEFFRALRGETAGDSPFVPTVPATYNADALALADYWTDQIARVGDKASDTYHRLIDSCWREVMHRVMKHAKHAPAHEPYAFNAEFWSALLLLTTQSDACNAAPVPWAFHVPATCPHRRNAAAVDTGATLDFPSAKTWDEAAQMQRDAFSKLRGEDKVTGRLVGRVPRTTVADVRQLAAYWSAGLAKVGEKSFADVSARHVIDRWKAAVAAVDHVPLTVDPSSVYEHNTDFWEAVLTIAIQVAVTAEAPSRWQLVKEATKQAITDLPDTLKTGVQNLVSTLLARPLLYAGLGLGGLALVILLLRRSGKTESKP